MSQPHERPEPPTPPPYPHAGLRPPTWQPPYAQPPYAQPPRRPSSRGNRSDSTRVLLPLVAVVSLVVGLVGGILGAVAVSNRDDGVSVSEPSVIRDDPMPAPLPEAGTVAEVADAMLPSVVQVLADGDRAATGSGFVLDRDDHVITNNHVIEDAADGGEIMVMFDDESTALARVVGRSPAYDIAVLEVDGEVPARPAAFADIDRLRVGETVVAIGAPLGLSSSVTSGIVSALDRPVTVGGEEEDSYLNAIQTDAAINPGNSGGPLVNLRGEVIGVNSAIASLGGFGGPGGSIGVGFAIPVDQMLRTADEILRTGQASVPIIGAGVDVQSSLEGAEITNITPSGPADRAGLLNGDRITRIDDQRIQDGIELIVAIRSRVPGEKVRLDFQRDGSAESVEVTLGRRVG
jgi:putative serine protease PepD